MKEEALQPGADEILKTSGVCVPGGVQEARLLWVEMNSPSLL